MATGKYPIGTTARHGAVAVGTVDSTGVSCTSGRGEVRSGGYVVGGSRLSKLGMDPSVPRAASASLILSREI